MKQLSLSILLASVTLIGCECPSNHYGSDCKPCTCQHGQCNDTKTGDGFCREETCDEGWEGKNCNKCAKGYTGSNCQKITCVNGTLDKETGACSSCNKGWSGDNCDQCAEGWTGRNCNKCDDGYYGKDCTAYGSITLGGITYKTFVFNKKIWMAENLRNRKVDHYSADNNSNNDAKYGYLYTWQDAKKACPAGWRLPTQKEFYQLLTATGAGSNSSSIRASSWASGSNSSGFGALPAGYRGSGGGFYFFGSSGRFWSATPYDSDLAYALYVSSGYAGVSYTHVDLAFSVRCLRD